MLDLESDAPPPVGEFDVAALGGIRIIIRQILKRTGDKVRKLPKPGAARTPRVISRDKLSEIQKQNLSRFEKKLPRDAKPSKIIEKQSGDKVFQADVPARNIPGSFARYEKTVDSAGKTIKYTKTTYGPDGRVISIKDKLGTP